MNREQILRTGIELTTGDRNRAYGEPSQNMTNIAQLWSAYLSIRYLPITIAAEDVAQLNVLQKVARAAGPGETSDDTFIDAAVYSAIAGELHQYNKQSSTFTHIKVSDEDDQP